MARDVSSARRVAKKPGLIPILCVLLLPSSASAWGERGHHVVCEVATRLVQEEGLKTFLASRGPMLGHVCNIPDIYWRSYRKYAAEGDASHFINVDLFHRPIRELPLDFQEFWKLAKQEKIDPPLGAGSLWWRADQFFRLAVADGKKAKISSRSTDVFDLIVDMGLLGHFVADGSMPYHSTSDYDGWEKGRGGIHGYYESLLIDDYPLDLPMSVWRHAKERTRPTKPTSADYAVGRMRDLSEDSLADLPLLEKLDAKVVRRKSERSTGGQDRPAERLPAYSAVEIFGDLPVRELARSAALLAELWDQVYVQSGRPDLSEYRSYRYPLTPKFIRPDYLRWKQ
jgi:hypothetical protein